MIKTDLTSFDNLGRQAFPRPGVLKHRTPKEQEAILADPAAFFGDPKEVDTLDRHDDILDVAGHVIGRVPVYKKMLADPCPQGARGFGWWPEVDQSATLGIGETHGAETLTVDPANKRWVVTRAVIAAAPVEVSAHYDALEKSLHRSIDEAAEQRRLDFITNGAGQAATYSAKLAEAADIVGGSIPNQADHPFVWKEAAALGKTASDRAAEIMATSQAWLAIGSDIEAARHGAKAAVMAAKGDEAAMEAAAAVDWSTIGGT